ncbi:Holliday junction DNA helicase subunit RuvA [Faunimonas pinastri]|uniref:Holliday junction branch migration complex subunit RuvA n=1 Tax=Faunimonas pinastri TaxID=1855383 RepID=A0A1H8Z6M6_9HYPH|nr:Holliday junction branch migration protein RuvA [Faunimonas pinastri]SEP60084.1 Holliday junction DNA helicase subunit RuvA [Faunimonas pinastri]
MIGKLKGIIDSTGADWAIVDVHGVGYLVHCSTQTLQSLPQVGEAASLAIETHVREQDIRLFGFSSEVEREWFRLLITVQGIGTKVALAVLSTLKSSDLASAIALQDKAAVARSPGVGPKVAQRICLELKDKVPTFGHVDSGTARLQADLGDKVAPKPAADAVSALVNLGYAQAQASAAVAAALREAGDDAETPKLIRLGLKELAR